MYLNANEASIKQQKQSKQFLIINEEILHGVKLMNFRMVMVATNTMCITEMKLGETCHLYDLLNNTYGIRKKDISIYHKE